MEGVPNSSKVMNHQYLKNNGVIKVANGIFDEIDSVVVYDVELSDEEYETLLEDDELCDEFIEELMGMY